MSSIFETLPQKYPGLRTGSPGLLLCGQKDFRIVFSVVCAIREVLKTRCKSGRFALLDETETALFACQRGCPKAFYCEKTTLVNNSTNNIGICCPNINELLQGTTTHSVIASAKRQIRDANENSNLLVEEIGFRSENKKICEKIPFRLTCNNTREPQPIARWFFDIQTLECQIYPIGSCGDDAINVLSLKSKTECEEKCDVKNVKRAIQNLKSVENNIENEILRPPVEIPLDPNVGEIAIEDPKAESKHVRSRPFAIEPPTDLIHIIDTPSDVHILRRNIHDDDQDQLLTVTDSVPSPPATVTTETLTVLDGNETEGSGAQDDGREILEDEKTEKEKEEVRRSLKSIENSFEQFYKQQKELAICSKTDYRFRCPSGKPSQFVYRWELVDGKCQSFPYGYCWQESNHAHPRTRLECELFCAD
ncbi:unnamed protein product [Caenorhabditis bovis]|uniref:BPTI/Kunitz inhibitor domain-containing protein n=1 Tax=Caenorhabditis bovis TaxID=2654633 RepID=A0A8S1E0I9_9PELO|nr:unnamed protein product [Caenorhabditis bovis]